MTTKLLSLLLCSGAAWTLSAQAPGAGGAALLPGPTAEFACDGSESGVFEPGTILFLDRPYTPKEVPDALLGCKFLRCKIDGLRAVCRQAGVVYVVTPSPGRSPDSRAETLLGLGFEKTGLPEFFLLPGDANVCSVYQKQVAVHEPLNLGKWGVLVVPLKESRKVAEFDFSAPAEIEMLGDYESDKFQYGVKLFLDREYTLLDAPKSLLGKAMVRSPVGGMGFRCTRGGVVTLLTPDPVPQAASIASTLGDRGFIRVAGPAFQLFGASEIDRVHIYQKHLEPGEEHQLGRWAVLVGPKNVKRGQPAAPPPGTPSAEMLPAPIFSPGPEYADSARMFQGIPGIERAPNGRLWAAWYGGGVTENEHNYILLHTSGDDGQSWQRVLIVDPDGAGPVRAFDPCLWHDPGGRLWLTWAQTAPGQPPRLLGLTTTDSGNATARWSGPRNLCDGVMMNKPTVSADGRWLWPVARWFSNGSSRVVVTADGGETFTDLGAANIPEAKQRSADEHMIVERGDGTLWMLARTGYGIGESISTDGGKTWPDMAASPIPHTVSRFFIRRLAGGRLLLVRHDPPGLENDPALKGGTGRSHLTAFLSEDEGRTWKGGLMLDERHGVTYPDGVQAPDGSIYVIYDFNRQTDKEILFAKFREEDVLAGKLVSSGSRCRVRVNQATATNPKIATGAKRESNAGGAELPPGPAAALACADGEPADFVPGVKLFTDRDYTLKEAPEALRGFKFLRSDISGARAVCRESGVVLVVTATEGRNPDSRAAVLLERGFQKTKLPEFLLFGGDRVSVYQKRVAVDEALDFGKWTVVLVPATDAGRLRLDPAVKPPLEAFVHPAVNFHPGPEYGPDKRNYQGIPGIERAPGGRLWAVWYAGKVWEDPYNYVVTATSGDDGKTWSDLKFVIDPDSDGPMRTSDPCFWLDPSKRLWLFWWLEGPGEPRTVTMAMTCDNPDAETPEWSEPEALFPGVMLNKPTVLKNGDWLMPAAMWKRDNSARVMISKNQGQTFSLLGAANIPPARRNCDEHMIVERKDGSLMMLVRTAEHGIGRSLSKDGGCTWTEVADYLPDATSRFFLRRLTSGNLLLVKHGPLDKKISRSHLTAYLSDDDGATWKGGLVLDERNSVSYPDGTQAPDGTIRVIYDWERARDKHILMAVFTEADVLAGAFQSPVARPRVLINCATGINPKLAAREKERAAALALKDNADGAALLAGPPAVLEYSGGDYARFEPGVKLFRNRDYTLQEAPEALRGCPFFQGNLEQASLVCQDAGVAYVVTPSEERNPHSRSQVLLAHGFQKANLPEFLLFGGAPNICSVFQKRMEARETLELGPWGVVVLPKK